MFKHCNAIASLCICLEERTYLYSSSNKAKQLAIESWHVNSYIYIYMNLHASLVLRATALEFCGWFNWIIGYWYDDWYFLSPISSLNQKLVCAFNLHVNFLDGILLLIATSDFALWLRYNLCTVEAKSLAHIH